MKELRGFSRDDIEKWEKRFRGSFINSLSGFKSVNLCGTVDKEKNNNLSIISSVVHIGAHPPLMGMIIRPDTVPRDTLANLESTGYYTLNHLNPEIVKPGHQSSARYSKDESEFEATGLTPYFSEEFSAPYVAESNIRIGLAFRERHDLKINGTLLIIGEIQEVWLPDNCITNDGFVDLHKAETVTVAGLDAYHSTNKLTRLSYAKPNQELKEVEGFLNPE